MKTYAFIDASNMFYGGKKSLGWSIDLEKLLKYLQNRFNVSQVYYFGGVEIHKFPFNYIENETVSIRDLEKYLSKLIKEKGDEMNEVELKLIGRHYNRVRFYLKLEKFGYNLILKPVKTRIDVDGNPIRKANCDVDMTLMMMKEKNVFECALFMSGDGDFLPVLKHLKENGKKILILARGSRTAKEIKQFAGDKFMDFTHNLRSRLEKIDP
jgi:uncharacterized LabA/DUF88 family protein